MNQLTGFRHGKELSFKGAAGAATDYQVFVKVYRIVGAGGTEALEGGHKGVNAIKVCVGDHCSNDFSDVRFWNLDCTVEFDYFRDSYTSGVSALFAVEVADDLGNVGVDTPFCMYYGANVATTSNAANTFKRVLGGDGSVVLALPMNEGSGLIAYDYSGNSANGVLSGGANTPTWVTTGKYGTALSFDGNDLITVTAFAGLNTYTNFHFAAYYKISSFTGTTKCIIKRSTWYYMYDGADADSDDHYHLAYYMNTIPASDTLLAKFLNPAVLDTQYSTIMSIAISGANIALITRVNGVLKATTSDVNFQDLSQGNVANSLTIGNVFQGIISGLFILNSSLTDDEKDEFYTYYPQCSTANLGTLYLRSFVNPEPQPSTVGPEETFYPEPQHVFGGALKTPPPLPLDLVKALRDWLVTETN